MPDFEVCIGNVFLSVTISPRKGALYVCLLDQGSSLLDHDNAIIDKIAQVDNGFAFKHSFFSATLVYFSIEKNKSFKIYTDR